MAAGTHRDLRSKSRCLGPEVPAEDFIWQDLTPAVGDSLSGGENADLKATLLNSGLTYPNQSPPLGTVPAPSMDQTAAEAPMARVLDSRPEKTGRATSPPDWQKCWE